MNFVEKCEPADLVAITILVGGFILKLNGGDGVTTALMTSVSFYYFGQKLGKNTSDELHEKLKNKVDSNISNN